MSIVLVVVGYLVFSSIVGSIIGRFIAYGMGTYNDELDYVETEYEVLGEEGIA